MLSLVAFSRLVLFCLTWSIVNSTMEAVEGVLGIPAKEAEVLAVKEELIEDPAVVEEEKVVEKPAEVVVEKKEVEKEEVEAAEDPGVDVTKEKVVKEPAEDVAVTEVKKEKVEKKDPKFGIVGKEVDEWNKWNANSKRNWHENWGNTWSTKWNENWGESWKKNWSKYWNKRYQTDKYSKTKRICNSLGGCYSNECCVTYDILNFEGPGWCKKKQFKGQKCLGAPGWLETDLGGLGYYKPCPCAHGFECMKIQEGELLSSTYKDEDSLCVKSDIVRAYKTNYQSWSWWSSSSSRST